MNDIKHDIIKEPFLKTAKCFKRKGKGGLFMTITIGTALSPASTTIYGYEMAMKKA